MNDWERAQRIVDGLLSRPADLDLVIKVLLLKLQSSSPLAREDRDQISIVLDRILKSPKALKMLGVRRPGGKRKIDRHLAMAVEYLARIELGSTKRDARDCVAKRWSVEPNSVSDAITDRREGAKQVLQFHEAHTSAGQFRRLLKEIVDRSPRAPRTPIEMTFVFDIGEITHTLLR